MSALNKRRKSRMGNSMV